jgi:hypothetical protein
MPSSAAVAATDKTGVSDRVGSDSGASLSLGWVGEADESADCVRWRPLVIAIDLSAIVSPFGSPGRCAPLSERLGSVLPVTPSGLNMAS